QAEGPPAQAQRLPRRPQPRGRRVAGPQAAPPGRRGLRRPPRVIRLAVRVRSAEAEVVLAELLPLAPAGVEEVQRPGDVVEYAVYGAPGELPELPALRAAAGSA